ncbi:YsnF/AvaK domain-containing protein [Geobacter sp. DSM 9736]|uniref:YsnF/AvaK domain-containing protein n=1 Tax=Geobacter sp. DSM 9736 TaxID=1277350 RepID=UPI000B513309|nr:YsnF/AvaK domain-containing protein [Geobacter sp. DSM 9736]SNB47173.1 conserved domain-containing protein [Geobacter sp. DSM 9736]
MAKTVVGLMDTSQDAQKVLQELVSSGFEREKISIMAEEGPRQGLKGAEKLRRVEGADAGVGAVPGGAIGALTRLGMPEQDAHKYAEGVRRGGLLITVTTDNDSADNAASIMRRNGAIDIDRRAETWRKEGWIRFDEKAAPQAAAAPREREGVIPVTEEQLQVGKRQVETGEVRVYSHVTETPVEEQVRLREERAKVERRPVDRPATEAEQAAFREQSFEVTETTEEPVVSKQARVKEEVVVGKEATERVEQVRDTVRRTEVEVEKTGQPRYGQQPQTSREDSDFITHFSSNYATRGERFETYRSAYHYAESRSSDPKLQGKEWLQVEEDIHQDWERSHPGTWARFKEAIHYGWDKTRRH